MTADQAQLLDRITQDPRILAGKPAVQGTRIPVELVLEYLANNPSLDELFADYPRLTLDDVRACFAYSAQRADRGASARSISRTPKTRG